jgi:hypothetical protein
MLELNALAGNSHIKKEDVMKSMAKEQTEITDHIKQYLSKAEQFSVRMSAAMTKSQAFKSKAKGDQASQDKLFVDGGNVNLIEGEH